MRTELSLIVWCEDHELRCVRVRGRWFFSTRSWPALAALHDGATSPDAIVLEFLSRASGLSLVESLSEETCDACR
jgi:hypothetical protein